MASSIFKAGDRVVYIGGHVDDAPWKGRKGVVLDRLSPMPKHSFVDFGVVIDGLQVWNCGWEYLEKCNGLLDI